MTLNDTTVIRYSRTTRPAEYGYAVTRLSTVTRRRETIGYVRRSQTSRGAWCYTLDLAQPWTVIPASTRAIAADHLLSAYSPMAAWLA